MEQTEKPICRICRTAMILNRIVPCAADYDICSYVCADCAAVFSIVEPRMADRDLLDERRAVLRHGVTTPATIESGSRAIPCMVRNLSATGAWLSLASRARLPKTFTLLAGGSPLPCHAVWRRGKEVGIAFDWLRQ